MKPNNKFSKLTKFNIPDIKGHVGNIKQPAQAEKKTMSCAPLTNCHMGTCGPGSR